MCSQYLYVVASVCFLYPYMRFLNLLPAFHQIRQMVEVLKMASFCKFLKNRYFARVKRSYMLLH